MHKFVDPSLTAATNGRGLNNASAARMRVCQVMWARAGYHLAGLLLAADKCAFFEGVGFQPPADHTTLTHPTANKRNIRTG